MCRNSSSTSEGLVVESSNDSFLKRQPSCRRSRTIDLIIDEWFRQDSDESEDEDIVSDDSTETSSEDFSDFDSYSEVKGYYDDDTTSSTSSCAHSHHHRAVKAAPRTNRRSSMPKLVTFSLICQRKHVQSFTPEEIKECFWTRHEMVEMAKTCVEEAAQLEQNDFQFPENNQITARGLETYTPSGHAQVCEDRQNAALAVVFEDFIQRQKPPADDVAIAQAYSKWTPEARDRAVARGLQDEQFVLDLHREEAELRAIVTKKENNNFQRPIVRHNSDPCLSPRKEAEKMFNETQAAKAA